MTFGALQKGQQFRVWRQAGTGTNTGIPARLGDAVYTKVTKGACQDADGQWLNVLSGTSVQLVGAAEAFAAHQAADPHCTCNDCIEAHAAQQLAAAEEVER